MKTRVLTSQELRAAVPMSVAISAVREAFTRLDAGEFEMPVRTALGGGRVLAMTAYHALTESTSIKSVHLDYTRRPATVGLVMWTCGDDAYVLDAATATALRTGAVVGVATDLLAPTETRRLALIGLGGQAPDLLRAVRTVREFESVTLVSRDVRGAREFAAANADGLTGLDVRLSCDSNAAVADADVVCCATPSTEPLFDADALRDTVHVNAIGAYRLTMRELPDRLLQRAGVVVDQREAALEESGEIHHAIGEGMLSPDDLTELGPLLTAGAYARSGQTVFKSVGVAAQDWAIGHALWSSYQSSL